MTYNTFFVILNRGLLVKEERPQRLYAAAVFCAAGEALAWTSQTLWVALAGLGLTVIGGFISLGAGSNAPNEARSAVRYGTDKAWGLTLAILGACALASGGLDLWSAEKVVSGSAHGLLGAFLLTAGILIQLQSFPFLGWTVIRTELLPISRTVFPQIFSAWASLAILVRSEAALRSIGVFPVFGWVALGSVVFSCISGLVQTQWRAGLSLLASASFSLSVAALAFGGVYPALAIAVSTGVALTIFSLTGSSLGGEALEHEAKPTRNRAIFAKTATFFAALSGTGMIGFWCGGRLEWLSQSLSDPGILAAVTAALFLVSLLFWKTSWAIADLRKTVSSSWFSVISPFFVLLMSLGVIWTGNLSGGGVPGNPDSVMPSFANLSPLSGSSPDPNSFVTASYFHWGALFVAIMVAYWAHSQKFWKNLHKSMPGMAGFLTDAYRLDGVAKKGLFALIWIGSGSEKLLGFKLWKEWLPMAFGWVIRKVSSAFSQLDQGMTRGMSVGVRRVTDGSSKMLQQIQNGDVQWYLFFAIGSGVAILISFLRAV